ncbi:pyridoxamine 5'-phosphate oxidase family protein [Roseibium sp.]|uniref:pyridoxamine 5'-phosphate oxidase family protein n=1 Tax=Roseibium sp. TaxID=1936156 RepID=UPI003B523584
MHLAEIETQAWMSLKAAAEDPQSAFRYLTLSSVDQWNKPQARVVVLRQAEHTIRSLEFHTDLRSSKWQELSKNPSVTVLGYCSDTRTQLRFSGTAELFGPQSEKAESAWEALPPWTRTTYQGGPPGDELAFEQNDRAISAAPEPDAAGKDCFGVISFTASSLDWFQLQRKNNKRALFRYSGSDEQISSCWVNP